LKINIWTWRDLLSNISMYTRFKVVFNTWNWSFQQYSNWCKRRRIEI